MSRKRLSGRPLRARNRRILLRDRGICQLCHEPVRLDVPHDHPDAPQVDHIVPWSHGGTDDDRNLRLTHRRCNRGRNLGLRIPAPSRDW